MSTETWDGLMSVVFDEAHATSSTEALSARAHGLSARAHSLTGRAHGLSARAHSLSASK
jgi:hypothetical protein